MEEGKLCTIMNCAEYIKRPDNPMNVHFFDIICIEKYANFHYGKKLFDWYQ